MFNFDIAGITPRDIENGYKTFNFNVSKLFTGNASSGGSGGGSGEASKGILTTTGGCWFDTGYRVTQDTEIRCDFIHTNTSTNKYVFSDNAYTRFLVPNGSNRFGKSWTFSCITNPNEKTSIILNKDTFTCNDTVKTIGATTTFKSTTNLTLGSYSNSDSSTFEGSFYNFQIYEAGQLVLDWIPFVDADGKPCFKDTVTGTNHYHLGTGTLTYTEE